MYKSNSKMTATGDNGTYEVFSNGKSYIVTMSQSPETKLPVISCTCPAAKYNPDVLCKHASLVLEGIKEQKHEA